MKLRTSFFNAAVLRKDITRFAPAWGLYLTAMLLLMLTIFAEEHYSLASSLGLTINLLSVVNICYALVCAALLFGDLFSSKLCNALHAMPMRREGWFLTHMVSGLMFSVVPNLVVGLCLMPRLGVYWFVALIWVGGMTATYLFFFGAAVLSAMCTGNWFAMTLVYGLINFLSILIMWTAQYLFEPLLYGIEINSEHFIFLSPVSYLCTHELNYLNFLDKIMSYYNPVNGWPYTLGIGAIGLVMLIGSLQIYRKRHLESAGDFITLRALSPVFLALYTLAAGMALFLFASVILADNEYVFLVVGIAAGFITGSMLLKRTVKVFKPATFVGLAVVMAVVFGSLGLAKLDVLGLVRWVPEQEEVKSVSFCYHYSYVEDDPGYMTTDEEEIRELISIHKRILQDGSQDTNRAYDKFALQYTMKDGSTVTRYYPLDYSIPALSSMTPWFSKPEYVLETDDLEALLDNIEYIEVRMNNMPEDKYSSGVFLVTGEDVPALLEKIIADCEAGHMSQDWNYHRLRSSAEVKGDLNIFMREGNNIYISLWNEAVYTNNWLVDYMIEEGLFY